MALLNFIKFVVPEKILKCATGQFTVNHMHLENKLPDH